MREQQRFQAGTPAPEAGWYVELDDMGIPTNVWASMACGERLPTNPGGATWRKAEPTTPAKRERRPTNPERRGDLGRLHAELHEPDDLSGLPASTG